MADAGYEGYRMMWAGYWWVVRSDFGEAGVRMERLRGGKRPTGQFQNIGRASLDHAKADGRLVGPATTPTRSWSNSEKVGRNADNEV